MKFVDEVQIRKAPLGSSLKNSVLCNPKEELYPLWCIQVELLHFAFCRITRGPVIKSIFAVNTNICLNNIVLVKILCDRGI